MAARPEYLAPLDSYKVMLDTCITCPKLCVHACPVGEATGNERFSPWGKMTMAAMMYRGLRPLTAEDAEVFYYCLGCMQCTAVCKPLVLVEEVLAQGRIAAHRAGIAPESINQWHEHFRRFNNPYGENLNDKQRDLVEEIFWSETPQAIYLPGSTQLALAPEHTSRVFKLFQTLGIDYVGLFVGSDTDLGVSLYRMGLEDLFRKHAYRIYRQLLGFKLIVTADADVLYALRILFPRYGYNVTARVQHISEFLLPYVQNHHTEATDDRAWALHESPALTRHLGIEAEPLRLLRVLFRQPSKPLHWHGRETWSSGFEEPVATLFPDVSRNIARRRINELLERGARLVVTTSPGDYAQLKKHAPSHLAVEEIIDIVYDHFVGPDA